MSRDEKKKDPREKFRPPLFRRLEEDDEEEKPRRKFGRPTKITQQLIKMIALHILSGADIKDAALMAGICEKTFYKWRSLGLKGIASTNPEEREDLAIYVDFVQTCKEARANHIGLMHKITTKAADANWQAADARLNRLERCRAMVRGQKEKKRIAKEAKEAAEKAAKEAETEGGGKAAFQMFWPGKTEEPPNEVCESCGAMFTVACDAETMVKAADMWPAYTSLRPEHEGEFRATRLLITSFRELVQRARGPSCAITTTCLCGTMSTQAKPKSILQRFMAGEELPIELLHKVAELVGGDVDIEDVAGTAVRLRKMIGT